LKHLTLAALAVLTLVLGACQPATNPTPGDSATTGSFKVNLSIPTNIKGAYVILGLYSDDSRVPASTLVSEGTVADFEDGEGEYEFENVEPGSYFVRATLYNGADSQQSYDLTPYRDVKAGHRVTWDLTLVGAEE